MSSEDWDHITIVGGGQALGRNVKVYRNGELIKGLRSFTLAADTMGAIELTTIQLINLEGAQVDVPKEEPDAIEQ